MTSGSRFPGHGTAKINAAFAFGGPQLTIATIKQDFNIPISHYLEVDFAGFRDIVNAIGSVPIYFPTPARDTNTGLKIDTPGCHHLNGDEALAYVRSRYYQYQTADGQWHYDPTSDIGRIHRQQYFIRSLSQGCDQVGVPESASSTTCSTRRSRASPATGTSGVPTSARSCAFRNTDPTAFPMYTLPATNAFRDSQSVLLLDDAQAAPTLARLRNAQKKTDAGSRTSRRRPFASTSRTARASAGAAGKARTDLGADGFALGGPAANADRSDYDVTEVRYGPAGKTKAELVLAYLGGAGKLVSLDSAPSGADVELVLGRTSSR